MRQAKFYSFGVLRRASVGTSGAKGLYLRLKRASSFVSISGLLLSAGMVREVGRRQAGGRVAGEQVFEQRGHVAGARRGELGRGIGEGAAPAIGIARLVERLEPGERGPRVFVHEPRRAQVPAGDAQAEPREVAEARGYLKSAAEQRDRTVAAALRAHDGGAERAAQRLGGGTLEPYGAVAEKALERRTAELGVKRAIMLELGPGLRRLIQDLEGELFDPFQHGQEPALDLHS